MFSTTRGGLVPAKIKEELGALAERTRRTKSFLAGEAIAGYVERELEIIGGIERGLDDMKAGRVVPHDEAMRDIRTRIHNTKSSG